MTDIKVPFIDLQQRFVEEREELLACVERVLAKGHLVMTPEVFEFEQKIVEYTGAKHCVSCGNGTDGLMLALWALGIGKDHEVITTPISFVASTGSIAHVGATPVYADVRDDQNIDPAEIEKKITPKTKAILPVHWGGRVADMNAIMAIAKKHNLKIVEDSAQSMGAYYYDKHGGTFGDAGTISTHPLKNLNAIGPGGMSSPGDFGNIENGSDCVRGQRAGHDPGPRGEQLLQVFRMKPAIVSKMPPYNLRAFTLQGQPDGNVGFVVKIGHDDFTAVLQRLTNGKADEPHERGGIHAK